MTPRAQLATKAKTLENLEGCLKSARVLPQCCFTVSTWRRDSDRVCAEVLEQSWGRGTLIVRSSALREDGPTSSHAGQFKSVLRVTGRAALHAAVGSVVASYGHDGSEADEVLIQPMLDGVLRSGVAFTADPATGAPYRVIEWVDGGDTTAVTSGQDTRTYYRAKNATTAVPGELAGVLALLTELEALFPDTPLDIEFAVTTSGLVLLQVRAVVLRQPLLSADQQAEWLSEVGRKVAEGVTPQPFLHGRRTLYGVMPDWNPAEIIGTRPRPLAFSLYRELITDITWAYQRNNYGYKNLRSHPLLIDLCGLPYVDVRVSFNSFIPRDIENGLADRLADYYLERLAAHPQLHDKVEFEVLYTCYSFDLHQRIDHLRGAGFSDADRARLVDSLRSLTNRIINGDSGLWRSDAGRIETLTARRRQLYAAETNSLTRIYWLLEDCKRYGTLPFAGLARAGFIAVELLRSLVAVGVLTEAERDRFINSLDAISSQLPRDLAALERSAFLEKYGHLRPGTYDILSPRYDEAPDAYFDWSNRAEKLNRKDIFSLSLAQMRTIERLLEQHGLEHDVIGFFDFLKAGIELRESSKFEFTRNLSDALVLIGELGERYGFTKEDLSYLSIDAIYELYRSSADPRGVLARSIEAGRDRYAQTCRIVLPPLIHAEVDVWGFEMPATSPNFITQQRVRAEVTDTTTTGRLAGRIVCIASADPGYDWLFAHGIAGLVTAYGGANSHMAIRANELGLPAVIGAGESKFQSWSAARRLDIDCANRKVEILA